MLIPHHCGLKWAAGIITLIRLVVFVRISAALSSSDCMHMQIYDAILKGCEYMTTDCSTTIDVVHRPPLVDWPYHADIFELWQLSVIWNCIRLSNAQQAWHDYN